LRKRQVLLISKQRLQLLAQRSAVGFCCRTGSCHMVLVKSVLL
jgi:hypothetical protein